MQVSLSVAQTRDQVPQEEITLPGAQEAEQEAAAELLITKVTKKRILLENVLLISI